MNRALRRPGQGAEKARPSPSLQSWLTVLVPLALFAGMLALFGMRYTTNDDATIANIAAGAYGGDRIHLIYVNILLGLGLRPLYAMAGGVNWYMLMQLVLSLVSCAVLLRLAMERLGTARGLCVFLGAALVLAPQVFYSVQYVKTASLCCAAGLLTMADTWHNPCRRTALGVLLAWLGSLLRWDMFCAVGGLSAALFLTRFFALEKPQKRRAACTMALLLLLAFAAKGADTLCYRIDGGWRAYADYNAARTEFSDFKALHMPEGNPFAEDGVSDTDLGLLLSWNYYDGRIFPADRVAQLAEKLPGLPLAQTAKDALRAGAGMVYGEWYRAALALTVLAGLILLKWNRRSLAFWGVGALLGLEILYLTFRGRFPHYVEAALQLCAVPMLLSALAQGEWRTKPGLRICSAYLGALALCALVSFYNLWGESRYYRETRIEADASALYAMSTDKEHLYLIPTSYIDAAAGYDVWHPRPEGFFSNIVAYGGWLSHAPFREEALAEYGLASSPLLDAVDNSRVFVGADDIASVALYASEHLGQPVEAVHMGENPLAPYQLRTAADGA